MISSEKLKSGDIVYGYWYHNHPQFEKYGLQPVKGMITCFENQKHDYPSHTNANFFIPFKPNAESFAYSQLDYEKVCPIDDIFIETTIEKAVKDYNRLLTAKACADIKEANKLLEKVIPTINKDTATNTMGTDENCIDKAKQLKRKLDQKDLSVDDLKSTKPNILIEIIRLYSEQIAQINDWINTTN